MWLLPVTSYHLLSNKSWFSLIFFPVWILTLQSNEVESSLWVPAFLLYASFKKSSFYGFIVDKCFIHMPFSAHLLQQINNIVHFLWYILTNQMFYYGSSFFKLHWRFFLAIYWIYIGHQHQMVYYRNRLTWCATKMKWHIA